MRSPDFCWTSPEPTIEDLRSSARAQSFQILISSLFDLPPTPLESPADRMSYLTRIEAELEAAKNLGTLLENFRSAGREQAPLLWHHPLEKYPPTLHEAFLVVLRALPSPAHLDWITRYLMVSLKPNRYEVKLEDCVCSLGHKNLCLAFHHFREGLAKGLSPKLRFEAFSHPFCGFVFDTYK